MFTEIKPLEIEYLLKADIVFILGRRGYIYDTSCMHVIGWKFEESGTWWMPGQDGDVRIDNELTTFVSKI